MRTRLPGIMLLLALCANIPRSIEAQVRLRYDDAEPHRLVSTNDQRIYLNGFAVRDAQIISRVQIEPQEETAEGRLHQAIFTFTEATRQQGQPVGIESSYQSEYIRAEDGSIIIDDQFLFPVARNIPVFPDRALSPGDRWTAPAQEVHDLLTGYGIRDPLRFSVDVAYQYEGPGTWEGQEVERISASFTVFHREIRDALLYPQQISGESQQVFFWDRDNGRMVASEEQFWIEFRLSDGRTIAYEGTATTQRLAAAPLDRETVVDTLQRMLDEAGIRNTRIETEDDGVILVLEDIGFPPDSDQILPQEQGRLQTIGDILAQFPQNDLLIRGHTALAGTSQGRDALSIARARSVGSFFIARGVREPSQVFFEGFGATQPIAENQTEEGRRRNRRVEVLVLDN